MPGTPAASRWWSLELRLPPAAADMAVWILGRQGTRGVVVEEADGSCRLVAYFPGRAAARAAAGAVEEGLAAWSRELGGDGASVGKPALRAVEADLGAWRRAWAQALRPVRVGGIRVAARGRPGGGAGHEILRIVIPAGMAFGTGHHPSTQQALWALELAAAGGGLGETVVDVGTGSGVLAVAARRLGAGRVVAVDVDPLAVEAARANVRRNGVGRVTVRAGSVAEAAQAVGQAGASAVVANLVAEALVELAEGLAGLLRPGGLLVGAGIAQEKAEAVQAAWRARGLIVEEVGVWGGWAWVSARRPAEVGP